MRLSVSVKLLGHCLTVCLHWWSAREALLLLIMLHADLTLLLHTHQVSVGLASLFTAYMRCMLVLPLLLRTCVAGGTAYPCRGAIARCALVRRAEGARSRLLGPVSYVANVNNEIIVAFFPQPLQRM